MNSSKPILLLDANIFIEAHKRYYAQDICPGFWDCLLHHNDINALRSIDEVEKEIKEGKDELWDWAKNSPPGMFVSSKEQSVQGSFFEIMDWVSQQPLFTSDAITKFAGGADGWLVAYAKVHGMILVTEEKPSQDAKRRVPIPNVCKYFEVSYRGTFEMLRDLEVKFLEWHSPSR